MNNSLAKKFTLSSLLIFALPHMIMMLFMSLYTIVDGVFVSRYVGTTALSAINIVYPTALIQMSIAIMLATGGNAIIAKKMGIKNDKEARENFSLIILTEFLIGLLLSIFGNLFIDPLISLLGATEQQFELCKIYLRILFTFAPAFFLQMAFQTFFVTAGKPVIGLIITVFSGLTNVFLDYLFIIPFKMGIAGAALATGIGFSVTAIFGLVYFTFFRKRTLYFVKPKLEKGFMLKTISNGSSEMVTNLANAVTTFLFNYTFLKFYGEDGVAAITIVLYFQFIFTSLYFGYADGIAPVVSFKYGERDEEQLSKILKSSFIILSFSEILCFTISQLVLKKVLLAFTPIDSNVYSIALTGFRIYSVSFLFMGISMLASAWFTALSDGKASAIISFARTFLFLIGAIIILPMLMGSMGSWISVPCAEILGIILSIFYFKKYKKKYKY